MSADLFAVFGTSDKPSKRVSADRSWTHSQTGAISNSATKQSHPLSSKTDVLFDADEADAEDDFGDFEDVEETSLPSVPIASQAQPKVATTQASSVSDQLNLLDLGDEPAPIPHVKSNPSAAKVSQHTLRGSEDMDEWGDFEDFASEKQAGSKAVSAHSPSKAISHVAPTAAPKSSTIKEDDWEGFEDWNSSQTATTNVAADSHQTASMPRPELPDEPAPSNIPPPTILLQLLPQVFQSVQEFAQSDTSDVDIDETAASIVTIFNVSARVIAGRALRWKRDTYLAQSTRIGPSTAGARSGGMKLTAVNKSEAIREEREAADVCDSWSRNTYIFAGVVSRSEHRRPWMNLNIKMTPRASPGFGTLESRDPCALCGIKRDERIAGVDFDVDDVFDEYWTEHWGHTDCKVFWYTYKEMLDQR